MNTTGWIWFGFWLTGLSLGYSLAKLEKAVRSYYKTKWELDIRKRGALPPDDLDFGAKRQ